VFPFSPAPALLAFNFLLLFLFVLNPPVYGGDNKGPFPTFKGIKFMGPFMKFMQTIEGGPGFWIAFIN